MLSKSLPGNPSAEAQVLLCCARTHHDEKAAEQLRALLEQDLDWPYVLELATCHHVVPLLYWNLREAPVPPPVLQRLRTAFHIRAARTLRMTGELLELLRRLEAADIPVIPYKGPVLAAAVFDNPALRTYYDVDVLVHEPDVLPACNVLHTMGYEGAFSEALPPTKSQFTLVHPAHGTKVEIHWRLSPPRLAYDFDLDAIWKRREPATMQETVVYTLGAEDLMVLLCTHGTKHFWRRLHWLCSVAEMLRACPTLDWKAILQQADQMKARRSVLLGIRLARDLLDAPVPATLNPLLDRRMLDVLTAQVRGWLFDAPGAPPDQLDPPGGMRRAWFQIRVRETFNEGTRYGLHRLKRMTERATRHLRRPTA